MADFIVYGMVAVWLMTVASLAGLFVGAIVSSIRHYIHQRSSQ